MSGIPLTFYTAVRGYSWHCANGLFSESDYSLVEKRLFADEDIGFRPLACVFSSGNQVFFYRHLRAENYDFNMRSADYYVVGVVPKYEARDIDFKWIFQNDFFVKPISRDEAMAERFPSYLDYKGGRATDDIPLPSDDIPVQMDSGALSSIGNWIERENGDIIAYIANDIERPTVKVKVERKRYESVDSNESDGSNESGAAAFEMLEAQHATTKEGEDHCQKEPEQRKDHFLCNIGRKIMSMLGWRSSVQDKKEIDENGYKVIPELRDSTK